MAVSVLPTPQNSSLARPAGGAAAVKRLLVLVPPEAGLDAELAAQAWRLAAPAHLPVVLVGLAHDAASEARRRLQLAGLAALTRDEAVPVLTRLELAPTWLAAVRRVWRPGDLLLCFSGQVAAGGWLGRRGRPLADALRAALGAPLIEAELPTVWDAATRGRPRAVAAPIALLAALLVIGGFFALQAYIVRMASPAEELLLLGSVVVEFALLRVIGNW